MVGDTKKLGRRENFSIYWAHWAGFSRFSLYWGKKGRFSTKIMLY